MTEPDLENLWRFSSSELTAHISMAVLARLLREMLRNGLLEENQVDDILGDAEEAVGPDALAIKIMARLRREVLPIYRSPASPHEGDA